MPTITFVTSSCDKLKKVSPIVASLAGQLWAISLFRDEVEKILIVCEGADAGRVGHRTNQNAGTSILDRAVT